MKLEHYREVVDRIRQSGSDALINLTTGPGARFVPGDEDPQKPGPGTTLRPVAERVRHVVKLKPEICSLDMGSMNMGSQVFINTPSQLEIMARAIQEAGVLPELEIFDAGHLVLSKRMIESGHIKPPACFRSAWEWRGHSQPPRKP
jgi:3-dehydrocarnitine:acetyl-CoA trimethylamine transferase